MEITNSIYKNILTSRFEAMLKPFIKPDRLRTAASLMIATEVDSEIDRLVAGFQQDKVMGVFQDIIDFHEKQGKYNYEKLQSNEIEVAELEDYEDIINRVKSLLNG